MKPKECIVLFSKIYDRYADAIYRHCFFRVSSRERAEELTQEAFMRAWGYIREGKQIENMQAFLYRVANNLIVDESRKKKEQSLEATLDASPQLEPRDEGADPMFRAMFREVMDQLQSLPAEVRDIVVMRYIDDMSPSEIAEILGITPNNASVKIHRALEAAKKIIGENHE